MPLTVSFVSLPFGVVLMRVVHMGCYTFPLILLKRVSIACYAKRCISYRKSVRLSVRLSDVGTVSKRLQLR